MIVEKDRIVSIQYQAIDETGAVVDTNAGMEPLEYLHGYGNILKGLEEALTGLQISEEKKITLTADQAYGQFDPELIIEVDRDQFHEESEELQLGSLVQSSEGQELMITDIDGDKVILDGNHPLAGRTLQYSVTIMNIRQPSPEELSHGHAHDQDQNCDGSGNCGCH